MSSKFNLAALLHGNSTLVGLIALTCFAKWNVLFFLYIYCEGNKVVDTFTNYILSVGDLD